MSAPNRNGSLLVVAALITVLSAPATAVDDAAKNAQLAQTPVRAPASAADIQPKAAASAKVTPASYSAPRPDRKYRYLWRYYPFLLRVRCAHIGCEGVHTLGVSY